MVSSPANTHQTSPAVFRTAAPKKTVRVMAKILMPHPRIKKKKKKGRVVRGHAQYQVRYVGLAEPKWQSFQHLSTQGATVRSLIAEFNKVARERRACGMCL